jgi:hypothetical protein
MPESKRQNERLIVLLIIGFIFLNYPLLSLFSKVRLMFGIPVLYLYIFTVWTIFIVCMAVILEKKTLPKMLSPPGKPEQSE